MKLPSRDKAYVPSAKMHSYLLSYTHSVGQAKAKFFRQFGFDEDNLSLLESALLLVAQTETVLDTIATPFGTKYVLDGSISTPVGTTVNVRTVWIVEHGENNPRFVTAYPRSK